MNLNEHVLQILKKIKPTKNLEDVKDIVTGGYFDSFELMLLITTLCEEFGITIGLDDMTPENFNSVESIVGMVGRLKGAK